MKKVKKLGIILIVVAVFCTLMIALPTSQAAAKEKTFKWTGQVGYGRANGLFECAEVFTYMIYMLPVKLCLASKSLRLQERES